MATKPVEVDFDIDPVRRQLNGFMRRQVPFAMALSLNDTVEDAQYELRESLPRYFTIRSTWVERGIRIARATKTHPEASVGSRDVFMRRQAEGGVKKFNTRPVGIPHAARKTPRSRITPSKFPDAFAARGAFTKRIGRSQAMFMPIKSRRRKPGRGKRQLKLLYILSPDAKVPARWPFDTIATRVFEREWQANMEIAWKRALRTAFKR